MAVDYPERRARPPTPSASPAPRSTPTSAAASSPPSRGPARRAPAATRAAPVEALLAPPRAGARPRAGGPRLAALGPAGARLRAHADRGRALLLPRPRRWSRSSRERTVRARWRRSCGPATPMTPPRCCRRARDDAGGAAAARPGRRSPRSPPISRPPASGRSPRWAPATPSALRGAARVVAGPVRRRGRRRAGAAGRAPGPGVGHRPRRASSRPRSSCAPTTSSTSARSRPAASRRPTPALEHVVLAALCALRGRRHGGLTDRVEALVRDAAADGPARRRRARAGRRRRPARLRPPALPGRRPPRRRAPAAAAAARRPRGRRPAWRWRRSSSALRPDARPRPGRAGARAAACPPGAALGLFALGRSAGWIAHALEARRDDRLIRPRVALHRARRRWDHPRHDRATGCASTSGCGPRGSSRRARSPPRPSPAAASTWTAPRVKPAQGRARGRPARGHDRGGRLRGRGPRAGRQARSRVAAPGLYEETEETRARRERERELRRMAPPLGADLHGRPSKRDRRRLEAQRAAGSRRRGAG